MATQNSDILLSVDNLDVIYDTDDPVHAVQNATFELRRGEMLGLAGESGCGKSTLAYSINQMLKAPGKINSGSVIFHDKSGKDIDIRALSGRSLREYRWEKTSMVFQGAMNSLSPVSNLPIFIKLIVLIWRRANDKTVAHICLRWCMLIQIV